jgi:Tol biopolymer transport system component
MFLVDLDGSNRRVAFDQPIGSHPVMHPDGVRILDSDAEGIYVAHTDSGAVERLATFSRSFPGSHHGTHPHPVWNRDGSLIIYNSGETGHSEIYQIAVDSSVRSTARRCAS